MANAEDVFAQTPLELDGNTEEESDAAIGALIHLYLRSSFDRDNRCWPGRDEHDTLRRTVHAVEVLYRLNFETDAVAMAREAATGSSICLYATDYFRPNEIELASTQPFQDSGLSTTVR